MLINRFALLAQLDRVFGYEPKGQGFESLAARQRTQYTFCALCSFLFYSFLRKGFEPERVCAARKGAGGTFSAQSGLHGTARTAWGGQAEADTKYLQNPLQRANEKALKSLIYKDFKAFLLCKMPLCNMPKPT